MENNSNEEIIYTCPNCGNQVSIEDESCPKCGEELTFKSENEDNETTIVIRTFMNEFEAQVAKGVLGEEGIESFVSKDDAGSMRPHLQLTGGVDLHVFEKDHDRASEILKALNL